MTMEMLPTRVVKNKKCSIKTQMRHGNDVMVVSRALAGKFRLDCKSSQEKKKRQNLAAIYERPGLRAWDVKKTRQLEGSNPRL